jgi:dihydroorotase (multifunctional complex type)
LREKQDIVAEKAIVDMALWGGVVPGQDPGVIRDMVGAGVVGLKSFMASSSPFFAAVDDADLFGAMMTVSELGVPYALHAESDDLVRSGIDRMTSAGRKDPLAHADSRPPIVEEVAVNTALYLSEKTGCWVHICHVASSEALRQIAAAKARGVRVTCETCPQYLSLNTDDLTDLAGFGRCAPAIRPQQEVDAIWPHVMDETVDFVCSDHCGFTMQRKAEGAHDIFAAPMGLSGIQTLLPVFFDGAVVRRGMALEQFVRQISTNAARFAGAYPRKGTIQVGSDADIVLLDPNRAWTVRGADMLHRNQWSPFEGKQVTGRVVRTIRRGETVYDDALDGAARVPAKPGSGRLLARGYGRDTI